MEKTQIQWTDSTVNFWTGCQKVSEGCKFCYMYRDKERYGQDPRTVTRTKVPTFRRALKWKEPRMIFTNSWSDFFIPEADQWRADAWKVIRDTPHHRWQILTKRPERILECLPPDWGTGWPHVWLGVSVENQDNLYRAEQLLTIPAHTRFISAEPLLGPVDLTGLSDPSGIHWVIVGGESGNNKGNYLFRPCELGWIHGLIDQGRILKIPVFVKQLGTHLAKELKLSDRHGGEISEWDESLRIREFPFNR